MALSVVCGTAPRFTSCGSPVRFESESATSFPTSLQTNLVVSYRTHHARSLQHVGRIASCPLRGRGLVALICTLFGPWGGIGETSVRACSCRSEELA